MESNTRRVGALLAVLLGAVSMAGKVHGTAVLQIDSELSSFSLAPWFCTSDCNAAQEFTVSGTFQVNLDTEYSNITRIRFNPIKISTSQLTEGLFNFPEYPVEFIDPEFNGNGDPCNFNLSPGSCISQGNFGSYTGTFDGTELTMTGAAPIDSIYSYHYTIVATTETLPPDVDSNGDGIVDTDAAAIGLDPYDSDGDTDNDGITDVVELYGDVTNPRDADGDGIIDALEVGTSSLGQSILGFYVNASFANEKGLIDLAATEMRIRNPDGGALYAEVNGTSGLPLYAEGDLLEADTEYTYPFGIIDFSVAVPGGVTTVIIELDNSLIIPGNAAVRKLDSSNKWVTFDNYLLDYENRILTLTLKDNDIYDRDATAGVIRDPVGIGVPITPASNGGTNEGASGGGGCVLYTPGSKKIGIDLSMILMLVVLVVSMSIKTEAE